MLGPHLPPPPLVPSEGRLTLCAFQIPDGSYRCLALEAEESSGEEGLQGEDHGVSRSEDTSACRVTQGTPQLPTALGIQPPSCSREEQTASQHDRTSQDWDVVKARQVTTVSPSPGSGPRASQKPVIHHSPMGMPRLTAMER
ncbi:Synaptopodin [Plecturocebus cupreus]